MSYLTKVRSVVDERIPFTASAARTSEDVLIKNGVVCIVVADTASGDDGTLAVRVAPPGVEVTKTAGAAWTAGQRIYWDAAASSFTHLPTQYPAGIAAAAATSAATTGQLALNWTVAKDDLFIQDTQLTSAEVKALMATNIEVVSAPAAGFAAVPVDVFLFLDHAGTNDFVQTAGTDHAALLYNGGSEIAEIGTEAQFTALIEASADAGLYVPFAGVAPVAATAIDLDNNGAAEYSGNAGADNTLSVRVRYRLVPMSAFGE